VYARPISDKPAVYVCPHVFGRGDGMSDEPKKRSWVARFLTWLILIFVAWLAVAFVLKAIFLSPP
jgi:hypothetical protein